MNNKQKFTVNALIAILIASLVAVWSSQESVGHARLDIPAKRPTVDAAEWMDDARRQLGLANNIYLLTAASDEVTGDNAVDAVLLVGVKTTEQDRFAQNIDIIVRDGKSGRFVTASLPDVSGYESSLFIGDFDGDKVNDVMVTAPSGGSGGSTNHTIAAFPGFVPSVLFSNKDNTGTTFSGHFLDNFQMELVNDATGRKTRVDIAGAKSRYIESGVYSANGKLLKSITPYAYPYGSLKPVDLNQDGTYELKGVQKVVGTNNADAVAHVYSYWQYNSSQGWILQQLEVASLLLGLSQENPPASSLLAHREVSKQMKSQYASVSYPQFEDMPDPITSDYVNQVLETAARELVNQGTSDSPVVVEYEVTRNDMEILSVIFKGSQNQENNPSPVLQAINIDLKSRAILSVDNLFRSDRHSHQKINSLIAAASEQSGITGAPAIGDWTGMYITNQDIVLYDQESSQNREYRQLSLPLEKTQTYFNEPYANVKGR